MSGERLAPSPAPAETAPEDEGIGLAALAMAGEAPAASGEVSPAETPERTAESANPDSRIDRLDSTINSPNANNERETSPARAEAKVILAGSQRLDQLALDGIDYVQRNVTERINSSMENATYSVKDRYLGWRVNSTADKLKKAKESLEATPTTGPIGKRLNRSRGRKVRKLERQLKNLKGFKTLANESHLRATTTAKDSKGNDLGISTVRHARQQRYQRRINDMLKVEKGYYDKSLIDTEHRGVFKDAEGKPMSYYDMVGLGRDEKRNMKNAAKSPNIQPQKKRELEQLIRDTNSVEKLEALGKKEFLKRLAAAALRDTAETAINHYMNRLDANTHTPEAVL